MKQILTHILIASMLMLSITSFAQIANPPNLDTMPLPFATIPYYPAEYTAASSVARMLDGLGYRYYWATDSLSDIDIDFKPGGDARTIFETAQHIHSLASVIYHTSQGEPSVRPEPAKPETFAELRAETLQMLYTARESILKQEDLSTLDIKFERQGNTSSFPFWHLINGPIADALWHTGQIVSFRRSAGNPISPKVDVFQGKNRD